jgi:hypothetical protein
MLGIIVSQIVKSGKVLVTNRLSRHVFPTETAGIKLLVFFLPAGVTSVIPQILQILVQDPFTAILAAISSSFRS